MNVEGIPLKSLPCPARIAFGGAFASFGKSHDKGDTESARGQEARLPNSPPDLARVFAFSAKTVTVSRRHKKAPWTGGLSKYIRVVAIL